MDHPTCISPLAQDHRCGAGLDRRGRAGGLRELGPPRGQSGGQPPKPVWCAMPDYVYLYVLCGRELLLAVVSFCSLS